MSDPDRAERPDDFDDDDEILPRIPSWVVVVLWLVAIVSLPFVLEWAGPDTSDAGVIAGEPGAP